MPESERQARADETLVARARAFALDRHGQFPQQGRAPISGHIEEVAGLVASFGGTTEMLAAAWLHDTVEDTDVGVSEIAAEFGSEVAALVDGLTDPVEFEHLPLPVRKARQAERVAGLPPAVRFIKLCDQTANVRSLASQPPTDWDNLKIRHYITGAAAIAEHCSGVHAELDALFAEVVAATTGALGD